MNLFEIPLSLFACFILFQQFRKLSVLHFSLLAFALTFIVNQLISIGINTFFFRCTIIFFFLDFIAVGIGMIGLLARTNMNLKTINYILKHNFTTCLPPLFVPKEIKEKQEEIIRQVKTKSYKIIN